MAVAGAVDDLGLAGGVGHDEGGASAAIEVEGLPGAAFLQFAGDLMDGEAGGIFGAAAIDDHEDEHCGILVDGNGSMGGGAAIGAGVWVIGDGDLAVDENHLVTGDDLARIGWEMGALADGDVALGINDERGPIGEHGSFGVEPTVGHGEAAGASPVTGVITDAAAEDHLIIFGGEEIRVDCDVESIARGHGTDGHEGGFPGRGEMGIVAAARNLYVDGWAFETDGDDVEVEWGGGTDFVLVGDAGEWVGGGLLGLGGGGD